VAIDRDKIIRWYDLQAPFYRLWRDSHDGRLVREVHSLLRSCNPGASILDAGCGTGMFGIGLAMAEPGWRISAADASEGMLGVARKQAARRGVENIEWRKCDATSLPYDDGRFAAVVAAGLMPCLNEPSRAIAEFHRVLGPAGLLITVEFDRASMGLGARLFFNTMILGYKSVAAILPRYRFATKWNIDSSTIDPDLHRAQLESAGFEVTAVTRAASHILHSARRS
jgi:ubiquinone/menaquinone biosynthesis C-methylase UbiE